VFQTVKIFHTGHFQAIALFFIFRLSARGGWSIVRKMEISRKMKPVSWTGIKS